MKSQLVSTREAARLLGVGTTTIKRWSDEGRLSCARTVGKHRRFERTEVERLRQEQRVDEALGGDRQAAAWSDRWTALLLETVDQHQLQAQLLEERVQLRSWWRVADEVGEVISRLGELWEQGIISVSQEHLATNSLVRAISTCALALPVAPETRRGLLGAVEGELHTLGLHLVELCLREAGWATHWLGGFTPTEELERSIDQLSPRLVAVSASAWSTDAATLAQHHARLVETCRARGVELVVGGRGAWPDPPSYGHRLFSFSELRGLLSSDSTLHSD